MSGPLPNALLPLTAPASWVYRAAVGCRNRYYDHGGTVHRLDVPVISVGNITTGGVGKTPMVAWLARQLQSRGRRPVIAMRGYGAMAGEMSDEQAEYAERVPDVPVVADPDRAAALGTYLPQHPEIDVVLMDDGFQHRRLHRDLDLVLIDAARPGLDDRLLPAGHLREPPVALARADAVIVMRADEVDSNLAARIERIHGRAPVAWTRHLWTSLMVFDGSSSHEATASPWRGEGEENDGRPACTHHRGESPARYPVDWLHGKRVLTMLGVGNPASIHGQLEAHGATIAANVAAADHEHYTPARVKVAEGLASGVDAFVTTLKDWVKLRDLIDPAAWPAPIVIPELAIEFLGGEDELLYLIRVRIAARG